MRFALGPIPEDATFHPEAEGWTLLREPRTAHLMLAAIPLGVLMSGGLALVWSLVLPPMALPDSFSAIITLPGLLAAILVLVGFVLLHEFLHAAPAVIAGSPDGVVVGFWPRYVAPYFAYVDALPRRVQLACGVAPLVVLTALPFGVALAFPSVAWWMAGISVANALGSAADLVMLVLIVRQVPANALTRSQGHATWWRMGD